MNPPAMALPPHTRARPDLNRARRKLTRQAELPSEARPGSRLQGTKVRLRGAEQRSRERPESWDGGGEGEGAEDEAGEPGRDQPAGSFGVELPHIPAAVLAQLFIPPP